MKRGLLALVCVFALAVFALWRMGVRTPRDVATAVPPRRTDGEFVGSDVCRDCHLDQHGSWHNSFHRTMTQAATPEAVKAPFDFEGEIAGQEFRLFREDDAFWVEMDDPEWEKAQFDANLDARESPAPPRTTQQVVMTTGSHHFQVFWTRSQYGRELWQFPLRYDLIEQQWVHRKDVFLGPPEWRPGMRFRVWNDDCILCHSVGGRPGLDRETGWMSDTAVAELGISCEACHGPGEAHVAKHAAANDNGTLVATDEPSDETSDEPESEPESQPENDQPATGADPTIVNPAKLDHELSSQVCGACHSNFLHDDPDLMVDGSRFRPGKRLTEVGRFYRPQLESEEDIVSRFWKDGVSRSTGREFMGVMNSPCYKRGELSCLSCHSMHNSEPDDQLASDMHSNEACLQCHSTMRDNVSAHTHHAADSAGSQCYNCHMPHTNYALFKATRSHQVTSPTASTIEHKSRPNACNLCHLDQTLAWTADHLETWYDQPRPELQEDELVHSAWALLALRGDAGQRVVAAWHPRWKDAQDVVGTMWAKPVLEELAQNDPYAAVRYVAAASLKRLHASGDGGTADGDTGQVTNPETATPVLDAATMKSISAERDETPIASVE